MKKELQSTWLVQRLRKPLGNGLVELFSFGGGLKNGGLSEDAISLLRPIFSFDYMGSAEFEFGAIPKMLQGVAKNIKNYSTGEMTINETPVFIIADNGLMKDVETRILEISKNTPRLKKYSDFPSAVGLDKYLLKEKCTTIGWMEIDNGFLFFTDKDAFVKTSALFGLKESSPA